MAALRCEPQADGSIPEYRLRRKIEQEVARQVQEHLIVFVDRSGHQQVWQWVKRGKFAPDHVRALVQAHPASRDAKDLFEQVALADDLPDFLTLPAYERLIA